MPPFPPLALAVKNIFAPSVAICSTYAPLTVARVVG